MYLWKRKRNSFLRQDEQLKNFFNRPEIVDDMTYKMLNFYRKTLYYGGLQYIACLFYHNPSLNIPVIGH